MIQQPLRLQSLVKKEQAQRLGEEGRGRDNWLKAKSTQYYNGKETISAGVKLFMHCIKLAVYFYNNLHAPQAHNMSIPTSDCTPLYYVHWKLVPMPG
jgi:hypothetical protein